MIFFMPQKESQYSQHLSQPAAGGEQTAVDERCNVEKVELAATVGFESDVVPPIVLLIVQSRTPVP